MRCHRNVLKRVRMEKQLLFDSGLLNVRERPSTSEATEEPLRTHDRALEKQQSTSSGSEFVSWRFLSGCTHLNSIKSSLKQKATHEKGAYSTDSRC